MSQSYLDLFNEEDIIEQNKIQTVSKGSTKGIPDQLVTIYKFNKANLNLGFKELLENTLQNLLYIDDNNNEIILVSKQVVGERLSLFLNFGKVSLNDRIDYLFDYLKQSIAYIAFDNNLIDLLIDQNQIVFKDNKLLLQESLIFDNYSTDDIPFSIVSKKIGQGMNRILISNFNELKTSKLYDELLSFSDSLLVSNEQYNCIDDIFNDFKQLYFNYKDGVLDGDNHPNNIIITEDDFLLYDNTNNKKIEDTNIITEVTQEERSLLTGITIEDDTDLSKSSQDTKSLDDIRSETKNKIIYGIPDSLKNNSKVEVEQLNQEDEEETKTLISKFNFKIPLFVTIALVFLLSIIFIPKLFDKPEEIAKRPDASFHIDMEGNTLYCENLSIAYNDENIDSSYWQIMRNGVLVGEKKEDEKVNFSVTNLSEGEYEITLIVTDSKKRNSDPFTITKLYQNLENQVLENQAIIESKVNSLSTSNLNSNKTTYSLSTTINVSEDFSVNHDGNESLKADLSLNNNSASFSYAKLSIEERSNISFWLMSSETEPIKILLVGYNGDENVFSKEIIHTPHSKLNWSFISTQIEVDSSSKLADKLVLKLSAKDSNIWIDELSIKTFK